MKSFFLILLLMTSLSSHAGVKEDVVSLGKLAFGTRTETVLGKSAEAMFGKWIEYDRKEFVTKEIDEMNDGDEDVRAQQVHTIFLSKGGPC